MSDIISQFRGKRILVVGDLMLDTYIDGAVDRINPEAPVPIFDFHTQRHQPGGAANVVANLASLGAGVKGVGVVGIDEAGMRIARLAAPAGIYTIADPDRITTEKTRLMVRRHQVMRVDGGSVNEIGGPVEDSVVKAIRALSSGVDAIMVSDYAKGVITGRVSEAIFNTKLPIMADMKPRNAGRFIGAAMVSPNLREAREITGLHHAPVHEVAFQLHRYMAADVFLTLGEEGIYIHTRALGGLHVPLDIPVNVADTSGCGDTAAAVILLARLSGAEDIESARLANLAGGIVASRVGAVSVTMGDLMAASEL